MYSIAIYVLPYKWVTYAYSQALYQKILDQGFNESHSKSDSYKDWADLVLASERQIAYFTEMDSYKLRAQLLWTTTSGICAKQLQIPSYL